MQSLGGRLVELPLSRVSGGQCADHAWNRHPPFCLPPTKESADKFYTFHSLKSKGLPP